MRNTLSSASQGHVQHRVGAATRTYYVEEHEHHIQTTHCEAIRVARTFVKQLRQCTPKLTPLSHTTLSLRSYSYRYEHLQHHFQGARALTKHETASNTSGNKLRSWEDAQAHAITNAIAHGPPFHISPHCETTTSWFGLSSLPTRTFSIFLTTSIPSTTFPKTTCFPFKKGVGAHVIKNWLPFVFGPEF